MNSPAKDWRTTEVRLHGHIEKPCCGAVMVRPRPNSEPCPGCGTRTRILPGGVPVTEFGPGYLEKKLTTGIAVYLQVRLKQLV